MRINETKQSEVVRHIQDTFSNYETQSQQRRDRMTRIYKSISTFDNQKLQPRETTFKVNKAHEIENRILPKHITLITLIPLENLIYLQRYLTMKTPR